MCELTKANNWEISDDSTPKFGGCGLAYEVTKPTASDEGSAIVTWNQQRENPVTLATISNDVNHHSFRTIIPIQIFSLPSEKYKLRVPVNVTVEIYADEVLALLPELILCGEGENEFEAIDDLKTDIIDLLEDLESIPESDLGESPKQWKRSLELMVERCQ